MAIEQQNNFWKYYLFTTPKNSFKDLFDNGLSSVFYTFSRWRVIQVKYWKLQDFCKGKRNCRSFRVACYKISFEIWYSWIEIWIWLQIIIFSCHQTLSKGEKKSSLGLPHNVMKRFPLIYVENESGNYSEPARISALFFRHLHLFLAYMLTYC